MPLAAATRVKCDVDTRDDFEAVARPRWAEPLEFAESARRLGGVSATGPESGAWPGAKMSRRSMLHFTLRRAPQFRRYLMPGGRKAAPLAALRHFILHGTPPRECEKAPRHQQCLSSLKNSVRLPSLLASFRRDVDVSRPHADAVLRDVARLSAYARAAWAGYARAFLAAPLPFGCAAS